MNYFWRVVFSGFALYFAIAAYGAADKGSLIVCCLMFGLNVAAFVDNLREKTEVTNTIHVRGKMDRGSYPPSP